MAIRPGLLEHCGRENHDDASTTTTATHSMESKSNATDHPAAAERGALDAGLRLERQFGFGRGFPTLFAGVLSCRWAALGLLAAAALQWGMMMLAGTGWRCPVYAFTGIPCPSCGLSRACVALLHGRWAEAWHYHAFVYALPPFLLLTVLSLCTPERLRQRLIGVIRRVERRSGITILLLLAFLAYYGVRLVVYTDALLHRLGA